MRKMMRGAGEVKIALPHARQLWRKEKRGRKHRGAMTPRDVLLALLVMAIWALNFPISKLAFSEFPPILFMAVRFALVALLICPFRRLQLAKLRPIVLVSVTLGTFHFVLM